MSAPRRTMRVSLSMIVRDEAAQLRDCLQSVAGLVDEIVVVDTGSKDGTRQIAAACGALVFGFDWCDDFAAARNASLAHCRSPWVLWMDADDRLDEGNRTALRELLCGLKDEPVGYVMRCTSPRDYGGASLTEHVRLFRRQEHIRWQGRIHEQIRAPLLAAGHHLRESQVCFEHRGYFDAHTRRLKAERNLALLLKEFEFQPHHPFVNYNLGRTLHGLGRLPQALHHLQQALLFTPHGAPFEKPMHALLVEVLGACGKPAEALAACELGLRRFADDPELGFHRACLLTDLGQLEQAAHMWERWLTAKPSQEMLTKDPKVLDKARHNLTMVRSMLARSKTGRTLIS